MVLFRYVSRVSPRDNTRHVILSTASMRPMDFAGQLNVSLANGWGIVRTVTDLCMKMPDGKYVLIKDPNRVSFTLKVYDPSLLGLAFVLSHSHKHLMGSMNVYLNDGSNLLYFCSRSFVYTLFLSRLSLEKMMKSPKKKMLRSRNLIIKILLHVHVQIVSVIPFCICNCILVVILRKKHPICVLFSSWSIDFKYANSVRSQPPLRYLN